jgi:hypothetical protein
MRDIDFIPEIVAELRPHLPRIEDRFNQENEAFKDLLAADHDLIGFVLKCHLIVENYINRHLESVSPEHDWKDARLTFSQKVALLPRANLKVAWVLPGIKELNKVRNRFGHSIAARIIFDDLTECLKVLGTARNGKHYNDVAEVIQDFTTVACTWLIIDPEIDLLFTQAFERAKKR